MPFLGVEYHLSERNIHENHSETLPTPVRMSGKDDLGKPWGRGTERQPLGTDREKLSRSLWETETELLSDTAVRPTYVCIYRGKQTTVSSDIGVLLFTVAYL